MNEFLFYFISPDLQTAFLPLKIIFLACTLFFVGFLIFFLIKTRWLKLFILFDLVEFFTLKMYGGVLAGWKWKFFIWKLDKVKNIDYHKAIIKCHDIFNGLLIRLVPLHQANTYAERLAKPGIGTFTNIEDLWWSYELYRSIKKDSNIEISFEDLKKVLTTFDQALRELEII